MLFGGNRKVIEALEQRLACAEQERDGLRVELDAAKARISEMEAHCLVAESEKERASAIARAATCFGDSCTAVRSSLQALTDEMAERRRKAAESSTETRTNRDAMCRILCAIDALERELMSAPDRLVTEAGQNDGVFCVG